MALMLAPQLQQYIHNTNKIPGTGVLVDLFLPHNTKVRIISTYIPSIDKELLQNTQEKVLVWVQQAKRKNIAEIIHEFIKPKLWEADGVTDIERLISEQSHKEKRRQLERMENRRNNECTRIKQSLAHVELNNKMSSKKAHKRTYTDSKKLPIPLSYEECTMQINKELVHVKRETEYETPIVSAISWHTENKTKLDQQIDELRKALHKAREKFTDNTKGMIKSVLKCKVAPVTLNNLKQKDAIITDIRKIKKETDTNLPAIPIWQDWIAEYNSSDQINSSWFKTMIKEISQEELDLLIKDSPNRKATGPEGVSNKMLKQLTCKALDKLRQIFNACLLLEE
ncbi:31992_t:CDS:2, partial [Gigaspora margarita]